MAIRGAQQQSVPWFNTKLGVLSSSGAHAIVAKKDTATRHNYMCDLIAQVCTGVIEEVNSKHMDWGKEHEDAARSCYEFETGLKMQPLLFVFKDDTFRAGCSPDGIISKTKGAEIKCPWDSGNYVDFLLLDKIKSEWAWQTNFTMWIMEATEWDVCFYDSRMKVKPFHSITVQADPEKQKRLEDAVPEFVHDMDALLKRIGVTFGSHWLRIAERERRESGEVA